MKFIFLLLALTAYVCAETTVFTSLVTTTRGSAAAATAAASAQQDFLLSVILDAFQNAGKYQTVMEQQGMAIPPELIQFVAELKVQDSSNGFPTSLFANNFPFTQFATFVEKFPWVTSFYDSGMTTYKIPSDYMTQVMEDVITSAVDNGIITDSSSVSSSFATSTPSNTFLISSTKSSIKPVHYSTDTSSHALSTQSNSATLFFTSSSVVPLVSTSSTHNKATQNSSNDFLSIFAVAVMFLI